MISLNNFRVVLVVFALLVGTYALASIVAETLSAGRPAFPSDPGKILSPAAEEQPGWLGAVSPFWSDLEADHALILALQALASGKQRPANEAQAENAGAQAAVKQTLSTAPYDSELWLALALLRAQRSPRDPAVTEALKMSYFVAPNDPQLMPVRLDTATLFDALSDPDLKELVRGDLRLMLTRQADLKVAVVAAYRRASNLGKTFLEEAVRSIDPAFIPLLRGEKPR